MNKSFKDFNKQIKTVTKTLKTLQSAFSGALGVITGVLKSALRLAVNLVKKAISAIKSLVSGVLSFVKSALSTLLSWMKSALGKIFDWISVSFKKVATTTINAAKKAVKLIVSTVQAYADKEYNSIQLRVSFGSDFEMVEKGFKDLLKYTTADKNDLWSIIATYAEMGKSAKDALKYARATVYLSNATGKSLDSITRMLLMQEALSRDLDRTLAKVGVHISDAKADMSDIERIIAGMQEEMDALMSDSLNQKFANVKNAWITIKETIGSLFAGPVGDIADRLTKLLEKLNKTIIDGKPLIDELWEFLQKNVIDKVFTFLEKFVKNPGEFFIALWQDIQTIVSNFWHNLGNYFKIAGYVIGKAIGSVIDAIDGMDFKGFEKVFEDLSNLISNFSISVGLGAGWFEAQDVVENSFRKTFINAWNRANEEFKMSADDPWYKNLCTLLDAAWSGIKDWWDTSETVTSLKTNLSSWWNTKAVPVLKTTFEWLGEVIGAAFSNFLLHSAVLRKIMSAIGMPIATTADQQAAYDAYKKFLPQTASHGGVFGPADITPEFLNSKYKGRGFTGTWKQYLETVGDVTGDVLDQMRRIARADEITQEKVVPTFTDLANRIEAALNPVDIVGAVTDANRAFRELDAALGEGLPVIKADDIKDAVEAGVEEAMAIVLQKTVILPKYSGMSHPGGNGGIADYFADEFKIKPYSDGGPAGLNGPEIALLGENGPEYVIPNSAFRRTTGGGGINSIEGSFLNKQGIWVADTWLNRMLDDLNIVSTDLSLITQDTSMLANWWKTTTIPEDIEDIKNTEEEKTPWYKTLWNGIKKIGAGIASAWKTSGIGETFRDTAFGTHVGNIWSGIQTQAENKTLTIWTAIGEVLKEFLPYLQKGLAVVGSLFDDAFEILGNAVSILGERIGKMLLPILEAFVPLMKEIADILIALSPVIEAVLQPAIIVIAAILRALVPILDLLMPAFAGIGAVIQWVSDAISWAIGSFLNWLGSIEILGWRPFAGVGGNDVKRPTSIKENYNSIMGTYNEARANVATGVSTSVSASGQTASYSGASHVYITNDFSGAYVVGSDGFRELAKIIKNEFEDAGYSRQNL